MGVSYKSSGGWVAFDATCLALWLASAAFIFMEPGRLSINEFLVMRISVANVLTIGALMALWYLIFSALRVYGEKSFSEKFTYSFAEALDIIKASLLGTLVLALVALVGSIDIIQVKLLVIFWIGATATSLIGRFIFRLVANSAGRRKTNLRKLLIVGVNQRSVSLATRIASNLHYRCQVDGFADETLSQLPAFANSGFSLVSDLESLPDYLRRNAIDEVLVCLPVRSHYDDIQRICLLCEDQGITVSTLPDLIPFNRFFSGVQRLGDQTLMTLSPHAIRGTEASFKRMLDIVISSALIILFTPLFLVVGFLVKVTSSGPMFFRQERLGLNKKRFTMFKFRSMVVDAEQQFSNVEALNEAHGPVFKIKDDPRITPLGRFLRKSSLDELPQLFNVLRGEMSLVGPRPLTVRDYEGFSEDWHRRRFSIRPGMTGLWQVSGRCELPFDQWMQLDMQYIDHWSIGMDFKLLLMTLPAVLSGTGAE